jgi:hypothetical protein
MPLLAIAFLLTEPTAGELAGIGLLCPQARYCSVFWADRERPERCSLSPQDWRDAEKEISLGIPTVPLPATSSLRRALTADRGQAVRWSSIEPVPVEGPTSVVSRLDSKLTEIAFR